MRKIIEEIRNNNFIIKTSKSPNERDRARARNKKLKKQLKEYKKWNIYSCLN